MAEKGINIQEVSINAVWNWVFFIISTISNIILNILYTNLLGPTLYGEYKIVLMIFSIVYFISNLISSLAIIKYASSIENQKTGLVKDYVKVSFIFLLVIKSIIYLLYYFLSQQLLGNLYNPQIIWYSKIYFIYLLIEPLNYIFLAYNISIYKIKRTLIISSLIPLLSLVFSIIYFFYIEISVISLIISILLANFIVALIWIYILVKEKILTNFKSSDFKILKQLILYSLPFYISGAIFLINDWIDVFVISVSLTTNAEYYTGIYSVARSTYILVLGLMDSVIATLAPAFVNLYKRKNIDDLQDSIDKSTKYVLILSIFLSSIFIMISPMLFQVIYPAYGESVLILQIFLIDLPIVSLGRMFSQLISASNRKTLYKSLQVSIIQAISSIITIFMFMYYLKLGILGAVISISISKIVGTLVTILFVRREMNIKLKLKFFIKPLIVGLMLSIVFLLIIYPFEFFIIFENFSLINQCIVLLLFGGSYILLFSLILILFKTFNSYDYKNLKTFSKRNKILYVLAKPLIYLIGKFKND
ncbi:MAG: oligosaccharide flippase family protein [Candidatus Lokiarchaeota archaeon]|nr:oligosaccharide flippase family protein [Candidatus Lokiarchaeota archaeon]